MSPTDPWWKQAVIYQVYPLSFQDSDDDGRGDLPGLIRRLGHLGWLGADAMWLNPVYRSPMADLGYDISDFTAVDPTFGSMEDFDRLVAEMHRLHLRLIVDFVPNHTSDQHPWFIESRSSRDNPKRDWYLWADAAAGGGPPNNWLSRFGGSAWQWDATTGQYYHHAFLEQQPDLNWRNPQVRAAMAEVLRFWLRRGVDGFRIDAAAVLAKDELLRNDPPNDQADRHTPPPDRLRRVYTNYRPEVLDWLAELREVVDEFPQRVLLGEVDTDGENIAHFYGSEERPLLHLPLNYQLPEIPWRAEALARKIEEYLALVPAHGWPTWLIGGHDKKRVGDIVGREQLRVVAMLLMTLPGTPMLYQGDELGSQGIHTPSPQSRDAFERRVPGYGLNRDAERAPMPWDDSPNAGFSRATPWLPLVDDHASCNVAAQVADPRSLMTLYRRLIRLRHDEPALATRSYRTLCCCDSLLAYARGPEDRQLLVVLNLEDGERSWTVPTEGSYRCALSTLLDRPGEAVSGRLGLRSHEGVVLVPS
jgi:alpha-glucosidase